MYDESFHIKTVDDVNDFAVYLLKDQRIAFHPDDDFYDFVDFGTRKRTMSDSECDLYNRLMDECFDVCEKTGEDIYSITNVYEEILKIY